MKITKKYFLSNISPVLTNDHITTIKSKDINEFKIGKNFFYEQLNPEIIKIQSWLNSHFQDNIDLNDSAVAFRKECSYLDLFEPHRKNYYFLRLDIKSFFHNIQVQDIKKTFSNYFENEYVDSKRRQTLLNGFINLVTFKVPKKFHNEDFRKKRILPMGFITSPVISNIIFRELDIKIQKFCSEKNIIYTRYADDMLFSSNRESCFVHSESFYKEIAILLNLKKFKLNYNKTLYSKHTLSLNGYTLQYSKKEKGKEKKINELRLSNKKTNTLKKLIYKIKTKKDHPKDILKTLFNFDLNKLTIPYAVTNNTLKEKMYYDQLLNKITGYRSYLLSIIVFNKKYNCTQNTTIDKYIEIIRSLNEIITKYTDITEKLSIIIEKERSTIK